MERPFSQFLIRLALVTLLTSLMISTVSVTLSAPSCWRVCPLSLARTRMCQKKNPKTALFFVPLVPGFSTASYLKVHIKTHHGSPLPTIHTFPEPRGELQMHNGNPFYMGRQCLVEGKRSLVPFQIFLFLAFHLLCCFLENKSTCCCYFVWNGAYQPLLLHVCIHTMPYAGCLPAVSSCCPLPSIDHTVYANMAMITVVNQSAG